MRHHVTVRWIGTFAAFALLSCAAACTSSSSGSPASSTASSPAPSSVPVSSAVTSPPPSTTTKSSSFSGPPRPVTPTLPADVPKTGPNTRPGEKPPVVPLEATQHTGRGAQAFAEFFIKTIDWGYATTSSAYMRHYFTKSCIGCRSTAEALDKAARAKHHFVGDRFTLDSATVHTQ